jgi:hypothetical protein
VVSTGVVVILSALVSAAFLVSLSSVKIIFALCNTYVKMSLIIHLNICIYNQQAMLCEKYSGKSTIGFAHSAYAFGALIGYFIVRLFCYICSFITSVVIFLYLCLIGCSLRFTCNEDRFFNTPRL